MWWKYRDLYEYDRKILRILGETHRRQKLQFYTQEGLVVIPCIVAGIFNAHSILPYIQQIWIQIATHTFTEGSSIESFETKREFLEEIEANINGKDFLGIIGTIVFVFAVSLVSSQIIWKIRRKRMNIR